MSEVYLDNSATTCVSDSAARKALEAMTENYGNPSSLHRKGMDAEEYIIDAQRAIAAKLGCTADELIFTSGGTESNNTAVFGIVNAKKRLGNRIVTTAIEHHSVLEACEYLEKQGFELIKLKPDSNGVISEKDIFDAVNDKTIFVSIMLVNNEVGSVQPVQAAARAIKAAKAPALLHCDAVQAFGKIPVKVNALGCDLLTVTAHKIHGPKGTGALYIKKGTRILPMLFGGEQQKKLRPGTQAVPLIAAFGEAVRELPDLSKQAESAEKLRNHLLERLSEIDGITVNSGDNSIPYIVNFSTNKVRSEIMLHYLESRGIYCSSGSACAKGQPSHVLSEMGFSPKRIDTALRISFSKFNTTEDIDMLAEALKDGLAKLKY